LIIFSLIMFYIWGQIMVELVFHVSVKELCHCFPAEGKYATIIINRTFLSLWNWGTIKTINYILNNISWNFAQKVVHHFNKPNRMGCTDEIPNIRDHGKMPKSPQDYLPRWVMTINVILHAHLKMVYYLLSKDSRNVI
jgi:hypothetical protein